MAKAAATAAERKRDQRTREGKSARASRSEVIAALRDIARDMKWSLSIPGKHYGGLSNDEMLDVRKEEGRDFARDNRNLRARVRTALLDAFEGREAMPVDRVLRETIADSIMETIILRVENGGSDISLTPLTPLYRKRKEKAGYGGEPIGVRKGKWRDALETKGHVDVTL